MRGANRAAEMPLDAASVSRLLFCTCSGVLAMPSSTTDVLPRGLRHSNDAEPGLRRIATADGFRYVDERRKPVRDRATLDRIRALAIPPAYVDVWICKDANGHLQATGRDARGRKQYRYHARWPEVRDETKFAHLVHFGEALPKIRAKIRKELSGRNLNRERVIAAVVKLLDTTLIRVGNEEYARDNHSYGLTTLRTRHVRAKRDRIELQFRGKSGVEHRASIGDPQLARVIRGCLELPGQELFRYVDDDGEVRTVGSSDVNEWLQDAAGAEFTAKDYRTWAASVHALSALRRQTHTSATEAKRQIVDVVRNVAQRLGNTPAVCRKCYVHPNIFERYLDGVLDIRPLRRRAHLDSDELAFLAFLKALAP